MPDSCPFFFFRLCAPTGRVAERSLGHAPRGGVCLSPARKFPAGVFNAARFNASSIHLIVLIGQQVRKARAIRYTLRDAEINEGAHKCDYPRVPSGSSILILNERRKNRILNYTRQWIITPRCAVHSDE